MIPQGPTPIVTVPVDPTWMQVLERLGLPIFLVVFACLVSWKLLPHVIEWFTSNAKSAKVVAEAVPDMKASLSKMANEGQSKLDKIEARTALIEARTADLETRTVEILTRVSTK